MTDGLSIHNVLSPGVAMSRRGLVAIPGLLIASVSPVMAQGTQHLAARYEASGASAGADTAIQSHHVRVLANNDEWTSTGLYLNAGDCVMIFTEQGKIRVGASIGEVDANGTATGLGQLRAKIGTSAVFPVGQRTTFCNSDKGNLKLKVSDTKYEDNSGEFGVLIIRVPGQVIPRAEEYASDD